MKRLHVLSVAFALSALTLSAFTMVSVSQGSFPVDVTSWTAYIPYSSATSGLPVMSVAIARSAPVGDIRPGEQTLRYLFTVRNTGAVRADNIRVIVNIPQSASVTLREASGACRKQGSTVVCDNGLRLYPGQQYKYWITFRLSSDILCSSSLALGAIAMSNNLTVSQSTSINDRVTCPITGGQGGNGASSSSSLSSVASASSASSAASGKFADVAVIIDDGDARFYTDSGGGWETRSKGYKGQERYRAATAYNTPRKWSRWDFGRIQPGGYNIYATWDPAGGSMPRNAMVKYQYEWSTAYLGQPTDTNTSMSSDVRIGQSTVYQDRQPTGKEYDGKRWQLLGYVTVSGTSQNVVLFVVDVQNKSLIADAAMLLPQGTEWPAYSPVPGTCPCTPACTVGNSCYIRHLNGEAVCAKAGIVTSEWAECKVTEPAMQCGDGMDNDGDGAKDYPVDPGCASTRDNDEYNASSSSSSLFSSSAFSTSSAARVGICPCMPLCKQGESCFVHPSGTAVCANSSTLPPGATTGWTACVEGGSCGNRVVENGEDCDDGNRNSGDGCNVVCKSETGVCGNGVLEYREECDDGNIADMDSCTRSCTIPACTDSDATADFPGGGANFAVRGTLRLNTGTEIVTVQDECYTSAYVEEWGCLPDGKTSRTFWKCSRGCADGRCR